MYSYVYPIVEHIAHAHSTAALTTRQKLQHDQKFHDI